jgi:hypothetical protein
MTRSDPPRLALALLRRFLDDNEPLAGDLIEGFAVRRSRVWFWREVLVAIAMQMMQRRAPERPLGLTNGALSPTDAPLRNAVMRRPINLTASPVPGIGGLGLVALGVLVAVVDPKAVWIFIPAVVGGVAFGVALLLVRRRPILAGRQTNPPTLLRESEGGAR